MFSFSQSLVNTISSVERSTLVDAGSCQCAPECETPVKFQFATWVVEGQMENTFV